MTKQTSSILLLFFILTGCSVDEAYRSDISECLVSASHKCGASSFQLYNEAGVKYTLATVEIDDQGLLRNRSQLDFMLDKLSFGDSALVIVYVHGWHHNAQGATEDEDEDLNIQDFRNQLAAISRNEKKNKTQRNVFGVYVGWRGDSIDIDGLNVVTFWDRKNTAQEVGRLALSEVLLRLEEVKDIKNTKELKHKSRLVVIGHSFGGAAVYSATAQIFADRFIKKDTDGDQIEAQDTHKGFGDLVVLINPAFEALLYAPLFEIAHRECDYRPHQKPILAILTSEGDWATGDFFPIGRSLYTLPETHNNVDRTFCQAKWSYTLAEGKADRTAVGHFKPFLTHTLNRIDEKKPKLQEANLEFTFDYKTVANRWENNSGEIIFDKLNISLKHLGITNLHNPFYNVKVSKAIIKDHNDIFKPEITGFLTELISYSIED